MSVEDYNDNVYSVYRPTSAEIRSEVGNVPPGRFREEVRKRSDEESFAESDPMTSYPLGITISTVSADADWDGSGEAGEVTTYRGDAGDAGSYQRFVTASGGVAERFWIDGEWFGWSYPRYGSPSPPSNVLSLDENTNGELADVTDYPAGFTSMPVSAAANWGPTTGEAGVVTTHHNGDDGVQTFHAYNNSQYRRAYTDAEWSAWSEIATV